MNIFKTELYKISNRRFLKIGLFALLSFFAFYFWQAVIGSEQVILNGTIYTRFEAIQKDKEIAADYTGTMNMEKAQQIIDQYGWAPLLGNPDLDLDSLNYNSCNRMLTDSFSTQRFGDEINIKWLSEDDFPPVSILTNGHSQFGYIGGWGETIRDVLIMVMVCSSIFTIIAISPVFSEEYSLKTVGILLSTEHGKGRGILIKILAALCYGTIIYTVLVAFILILFALSYGVEGLGISAAFSFGTYAYTGTIAGMLGRYIGLGLVACWLNTGIILFISSKCRTAFSAVIWSTLIYLAPLAFNTIILEILRPTNIIRIIRTFLYWMPFYLPIREFDLLAVPYPYIFNYRGFQILTVLGTFMICAWRAWKGYKNYQHG